VRRLTKALTCAAVVPLSVFAVGLTATASAAVLRVGMYRGIAGQYVTLQAAANAAKPGDWILIGPGDYKTSSSETPKGARQSPAAILLKTPLVFVRGMNRNKVIIDGTKPGTPVCSDKPSAQNYGPKYEGKAAGLNGIEVWKADNVWVQNLTTCNFTSGSGDTGNEIWWNGGAGGGHIHGKGFLASYLNATSTFFKNESTASTYGLFSSDWSGGVFDDDYVSNFNDSGFYIGGCAQQCDQILENSQAEYNALGYSGTNSGGSMLIERNKFDKNEDGFDTNAQNNSDWPSPQDGACLPGVKPLIKGAGTCWIFYDNAIYDNNNPDVPAAGSAAAGPVGTGVSIEGRFDSFIDNTFTDNGAWGIVFQPYPDTGNPPANAVAAGKACAGGTTNFNLLGLFTVNCLYDDWGNQLIDNTFSGNGFFGNPSNGDFAETTLTAGNAINCYSGNTDKSGTVTSSPADLQTTNSVCGTVAQTDDENDTFLFQATCDTEALGVGVGCSPTSNYPRRTRVVMHPLPKHLATMPNPCKGVPANPWCPARKKT
jgi:hypothetical protein